MRIRFIIMLVALYSTACASQSRLRKASEDGRKLRLELATTYVGAGKYLAAPDDASARVVYGTVLREQGHYTQAVQQLRHALRVKAPAAVRAAAWAGLGMTYDHLRRADDAERAHRRSLAIAPRHAPYWNNLGFSLLVAGKAADAATTLERAVALDPSILVAHNNLGFAYARLGRTDDARTAFRAAVGEAGACTNLALVLEEQGDLEAAEEWRAEARRLTAELELEDAR
jgi:Flp pilus assembly protein TadD